VAEAAGVNPGSRLATPAVPGRERG